MLEAKDFKTEVFDGDAEHGPCEPEVTAEATADGYTVEISLDCGVWLWSVRTEGDDQFTTYPVWAFGVTTEYAEAIEQSTYTHAAIVGGQII